MLLVMVVIAIMCLAFVLRMLPKISGLIGCVGSVDLDSFIRWFLGFRALFLFFTLGCTPANYAGFIYECENVFVSIWMCTHDRVLEKGTH